MSDGPASAETISRASPDSKAIPVKDSESKWHLIGYGTLQESGE